MPDQGAVARMSLLSELRRRNVFRVSVAYTIVAWLIAQVTELALESFEAPAWAIKTILLLLFLGLPVAVVFAWAFELTPDGIKREKEVDRTQSITKQTGRKLDRVIIVVLAIALALALATHQWTDGLTGPPREVPATSTAGAKSIAVLPFVNMSDDPDNEYFSDGISEELLNVLVKVEGLRVASRTSSFSFKDKDVSIPEIAETLNVEHVLEGSVRKAGDTVRITAQLIDVRTDSHLWSETYDRKMEDIFVIQDEISSHIVEALKVALGAKQRDEIRVSDSATANLDAYQDYLKGRYFWQRRGEQNIRTAITFFERATAADPAFAQAWSSLAAAHITLPTYSEEPKDEHFALALTYARKALELDDTIAETHAVLGDVSRVSESGWAISDDHYARAIALEPGNPTGHMWYAEFLESTGRLEAGLEQALAAVELDPLHPGTNAVVASLYAALGQFDKADSFLSASRELGHPYALFFLLDLRIARGRFDEVRELASANLSDEAARAWHMLTEVLDGQVSIHDWSTYVREHLPRFPTDAYLIEYVRSGAIDEAFDLIDQEGLRWTDWGILWYVEMSPFRSDPRFVRMIETSGIIEYWDAYGWPAMCARSGETIACQ